MKLSLLSALNAERARRSPAVLVTDLESGEQRVVKAAQVAADPLAGPIEEQLRLGKSGTVEEAGKPRTRKRALETLRDKLYEAGPVESLSVLHGEASDIDEFLAMISDRYPRDTIRVGKIGAVIGTHGGPAVIGICYLRP